MIMASNPPTVHCEKIIIRRTPKEMGGKAFDYHPSFSLVATFFWREKYGIYVIRRSTLEIL
jgi:hypothetical protein